MYLNFFGFDELPFSIVPNARYLYLSQRHQEAIVHLQAGLGDGGGFAMLTGEVGTEKPLSRERFWRVCRAKRARA